MKKVISYFLSVLVVLSVLLSFTGCASNEAGETSAQSTELDVTAVVQNQTEEEISKEQSTTEKETASQTEIETTENKETTTAKPKTESTTSKPKTEKTTVKEKTQKATKPSKTKSTTRAETTKAAVYVDDNSSYTVYITESGSKYHCAGCRYLSKSSIEISKSDAISRGYSPCSVCKP